MPSVKVIVEDKANAFLCFTGTPLKTPRLESLLLERMCFRKHFAISINIFTQLRRSPVISDLLCNILEGFSTLCTVLHKRKIC